MKSIVFILLTTVSALAEARGEFEAGGVYFDLSDDFADTTGVYARARVGPYGANVWRAELVQLDRFDDDGTYAAIANVHQFNDEWFSDISVGSSAGGFFWPELRIDATINKRWLPQLNLITSVGVTYFDAKDIHSDIGLRLESTYYTQTPWIFQGGIQYNESDPGSVGSVSGYGAVTHSVVGTRELTFRLGGGEQAYQPFENNNFQVDINFLSLRFVAKQWIGDNWGINFVADSYHSTTYDQHGIEVGLFKVF
ncbi:MAG: YaiO family outer membrane beta-barrel protein [Gammaproteobacteria bacterium]